MFGSGGAWTPAVNGKMPVAAWVPSRDTAGNGTTTLTDLVGSNDGTLTNMDAATDWVADTDAGGVRALDFDGVNDFVNCGNSPANFSFAGGFAFSLWINRTAITNNGGIFARAEGGLIGYHLRVLSSGALRWIVYSSPSDFRGIDTSLLTNAVWHHLVCVWNNASILYVDGINQTFTISQGTVNTISQDEPFEIGRYSSTGFHGLIDDFRIFDQVLDPTDVADLYAAGRGGQA